MPCRLNISVLKKKRNVLLKICDIVSCRGNGGGVYATSTFLPVGGFCTKDESNNFHAETLASIYENTGCHIKKDCRLHGYEYLFDKL